MGNIVVKNLGKAYKKYPTRWARLAEWALPGNKTRHELNWILQDINFTISSGEAVGIVGMNGAGKSTLLKMIVGTTMPTTGTIQTTGRVAALLELGLGFHPDFTGRQNATMTSKLLGLTNENIDLLMQEIEAFAEVGEYIDQPVRLYSSGMLMRLAFSVAIAQRPDVLIVDEALSVGDAYFQHKCFERIRKYLNEGTTLLFVSHDKGAIISVCDRVILLNSGQLEMQGDPESVMDFYNAIQADRNIKHIKQNVLETGRLQTVSGTGEAKVENIVLLNNRGENIEVVKVGECITISIDVRVNSDVPNLVLGYGIKDRFGQVMFGTNTHLTKQELKNVKIGQCYNFEITFLANLGRGDYSVQTALVSSDNHLKNNYEWRDLAATFTVVDDSKNLFEGCNWLPPLIKIRNTNK